MRTAFLTAIILALLSVFPASAHQRHHHAQRPLNPMVQALGAGLAYVITHRGETYAGPGAMPTYQYTSLPPKGGSGLPNTLAAPPMGWPTQPAPPSIGTAVAHVFHAIEQIVPHPSPCPWRASCGCIASMKVFGHPVRNLYLAANWFQFPRAAPGPGMAAVRQHHVFIILSYEGGNRALAYDGNSGHHLTRIHQVSLRGYTIVNPHGA